MGLNQELEIYAKNLGQWLTDGVEGEWVVIRSDHVLGLYPSLQAGYEAGVAEWGSEVEFLVKQVRDTEDIATIQRVFWRTRPERKQVG